MSGNRHGRCFIVYDFGACVKFFLKINKYHYITIMKDLTLDSINIPITIGCIVFLIQQTDFIYEYCSLVLRSLSLSRISDMLQFSSYENSTSFTNYISFLGSVYGVKKNMLGFACRLLSCFICLNCFISVFSVLLITNSLIMVFPCFLLSVLTFYILFAIKKSIYS